MLPKKRSITLTLLSIVLAFSCAFLALTLNVNMASATVNDSIYHNYITNGDFETEYDAWGVNGNTPERVDDGTSNHVGKLTGAGWVQARVWNAGFMYDNVYKISFKLKLVSADSEATTSSAQYLARIKGNDGAFLAENYVGVGCENDGTVALNEWKTYTYYLKIADNRDGTYSVLAGMDYKNLAQVGATTNVELSYFDVAVGCGNFVNLSEWYIDDYTMTNYTEYTKNIVQNGDFETAYEEYGNDQFWAYYGSPERVQLEDGNWVGKVAVTGGFWKAPRIWNASFMYDKTYRISFNIKLVGADGATTLSGDGQFLANLTSNDDAHIPSGTYIDIGLNNGCAIGDWKTVSYFIRIEKGETTDVLYTGTQRARSGGSGKTYQIGQDGRRTAEKTSRASIDVNSLKAQREAAWTISLSRYVHRLNLTKDIKAHLVELYDKEMASRIFSVWENTSSEGGVDIVTAHRELERDGFSTYSQYSAEFLRDMDSTLRNIAPKVYESAESGKEIVRQEASQERKKELARSFDEIELSGRQAQQVAKYTKKKVYGKQDAEVIVNDILDGYMTYEDAIGSLSGKNRRQVVQMLWEGTPMNRSHRWKAASIQRLLSQL